MDNTITMFTDELDKVSIKDAANMTVLLLAGSHAIGDPDSQQSHDYMSSMFALAKVGAVAVFAKSKLVPLLLEGVTPNDDTMLEDDPVIATKEAT